MAYFDVKVRGLDDSVLPDDKWGTERLEADDIEAARKVAERRFGPSCVGEITHALVCRNCGGSEFSQWEDIPYYNYVKVLGLDEAGHVEIDYEGIGGSGDGSDGPSEYWCRACEDHAETLEELVGLPLAINHSCPICESTVLSAKIALRRHYNHVAVLKDGEVYYEGFGTQVEDEIAYLECENDHTFQPTEHRLVAKIRQTL